MSAFCSNKKNFQKILIMRITRQFDIVLFAGRSLTKLDLELELMREKN